MPCTGCPALGVYTKILHEDGASPYTWDSNSNRLEILDEGGENIQKHGRIIGGQGITGKFYRIADRKRFGGYFVYGRISLNPSYAYLSTLLPYLVGSDAGGGIYTPGNCLNDFGLLFSRDLDPPWEYQDGVVWGWELSGSGVNFRERGEPDLMRLDIDMVFMDEARQDSGGSDLVWPVSEPSLGTGASYYPYIFQDTDSAFTLNGSAREIYGMKLRYQRPLSIRGANSLTITSACPTGEELSLWVELPWNATNEDLYDQSYVGAAAQIVFTLGNYSTTFDITNLTVPAESPYTRNRREIYFENNGEGYGTITNDKPALLVTQAYTTTAAPTTTP